ncbi:hypothetical protein Tco_1084762 [Tanacetum coccineum]
MLRKTPNKVYDHFIKAGLGYKNHERLKKAIAAQPKMYDGEMLHSAKLNIDSPDSEETLEDVEESVEINGLRTKIDNTLLEDRQRRWMSDSQNSLREFYKTDVIPISASLSKNLKELKEELIEEKNKLLKVELEKSSSDSKDIQANLRKRTKILENDFKRSQAQSIDFELKLQHQKDKMACDVSWKSKLSTINDENVLLKTQVDSVLDELIGHVNQKTYAYADVRAQNQDLLISISELKNKLQTVDKGKTVNTKSKPVTSHLTPKNDQSRKHNENVLARGIYRITKTQTQTPDSKTNINACNFAGVESSNSVRRQKSKDTKSKDRVLKNKNDKRPSAHVWKMSSSVSIDSNKRETMHSNVFQSNASVLSTKTVNAVNDGSNIVWVSCGKDVFLLSHKKCVTRYALSRNSSVKRALFTTPIAEKSKNLGATSVVTKSKLSVAKITTTTNKVSSVLPLSSDSSQSRTLSNYMKNKIATSRKWQKWFENQQCFNWTPKSKTVQSLPSEIKSRIRVPSTSKTPVTT